MKEYVAKKSAWSVVSFWWIVSCVLIIPIIIIVFRVIIAKKETITFYNDKIVVQKGWLNTKQKSFAFTKVYSVSTDRTLWGKIFNYGHLSVDFAGKNDINTIYIKDPVALATYLEGKILNNNNVVNVIEN